MGNKTDWILHWRWFLTEDALETAELGGKPEDHKLELRFQNNVSRTAGTCREDLRLKKGSWLISPCMRIRTSLTFSFPQLYAGAVGIRSGSLLQQYRGSALSQMLGELPLTQDIELAFVPGEEGFWQEIRRWRPGFDRKVSGSDR